MKKNKFIFCLLLCLSLLFSVAFIQYGNAFAEGESGLGSKAINSQADLVAIVADGATGKITGNYSLEADISLDSSFSGIKGEFVGVFDGNGHSITYTSSSPLFEVIGENAVVYNLEISNSTVLINDSGNLEEQNIGLLAGVITKAKNISGIKISNAQIAMANIAEPEADPIYSNLITKSNIALLAGKAINGANINNCLVSGKIDLCVGSTNNKINVGGLVGYVGNAAISNNIINLYSESNEEKQTTIKISSDNQVSLIIGGLIGSMDFGTNYIYNNVVLLDQQNLEFSLGVSATSAPFIGSLLYEPYLTNINGFITTYNGNYFGYRCSNNYEYLNFHYYSYANFSAPLFEDDDLWYDKEDYLWNFSTIWMKQESLGKLITLQCYETFNISFNIQESLNTLSLVDAKPTGIVLTYDIKNSSGNSLIESPDGANSQENSVSLSYDATIHLEVNLSNENNYNKFFTITGLELNGKTIFSINEPNKDYGYGVSLKQTALQGEEQLTTTFILSGINANHAGDYNVILTRNTYYLKTSVFDVGTEETGSIIPGKFKTNSNNNPTEEDVLELRYGEQYILNTSITNTDYSDKAFWYIFKNDQSDAFQQPTIFAPTEESANQYANSFQFTFNENCELFNQGENSLATILNLDDYAQKTDGEVVTSNYEIKIVYVKRVKQVKVVLMFNNEEEEQIKTQIAILAVANNSDNLEYKSDRFEWSQEEGVYYAKLPFDKGYITEYVIKIAQMEAGYEFDDWYFDFDIERLTNIDDDELAGGFDVSEDTEEPLVIYCVFKQNQKSLGANLLWLWLTLAGVGAVVLIIIMVIVAKKKRARSSYKKYYF